MRPATLPYALWADLLGKPFADNARGPEAYDCVGLFMEIQRRLGVCIVRYKSTYSDLALALESWERVSDPVPGDGILIFSDVPKWHIGVYAGDGYMLHAAPGAGVVKERINAFPWHKRIEGFYRWKPALP